jgi:hypothetical protein
MNRTQRRAMRTMRKPTIIEVENVFGPIDLFVHQLRRGEVFCSSDNVPLYCDENGQFWAAGPAVRGFAEVWSELSAKWKLGIDLEPVFQLASRLEYDMPIDPPLVESIQATIDKCREAYRGMDMYAVKSVVRTQEIGWRLRGETI